MCDWGPTAEAARHNFRTLDRNGGGEISREELQACHHKAILKMVQLHHNLLVDAWIKADLLVQLASRLLGKSIFLSTARCDLEAGLAAAGIAAPSDLQEIFDGCC